jgi:glycosyltransferase involved in cell wall biosynthesis
MKILVCTISFPYFDGNISDGRFVYSDVMAYAENDAEVIVLTPGFPGSPKIEKLEKNITVFRFSYFFPTSMQILRVPGKPIYDSRSFLALIQLPFLCIAFFLHILRLSRDVNIIHAQWTPTALLALPAKWIFRKILVVTARGSDIRLLPVWLNKFILKNVTASIDCFGPTKWNLDNKNNFPSNYIRLPTLVYKDPITNHPADIDNDCFTILYVGRFHSIKINQNHLPFFDLVNSGEALKKRKINFRIYYVGDGDPTLVKKLCKLIEDLELGDNIKLLGSKCNVIDYMSSCNLGIGGIAFNGVAQEYTICNTPQLFVDSEDNVDTPWRNKVNCLFVQPNDIQDLTDKLLWAYDSAEAIQGFADQASTDLGDYFMDSDKGGRIYLNEFEKLIKKY